MHLAVRADGGPDIGYGHLVRTGALAEELLDRGHEVTYATATPGPVETICPRDVGLAELPARDDPEPMLDYVATAGTDAVFADAYPVETSYQQALRSAVPLAIHQDDARHAVCADLFYNWNLYGPDLSYEFVGDPPRTCLGTDYALLRVPIRERAARDPPWRTDPERAVVTMGGSDVADLTSAAVRAFDGLDLRVDAVVGPGFSDAQAESVAAAADEVAADVRVVRNPPDLPERLFRADLAVTAAGSTVYELLALGTPFVSRPVVDNQAPIARALRDREAAVVLDKEDEEAAIRCGVEMLLDPERRRTYRERGRQLVDGRGTERVVGEFLSLARENSSV
jgi:spore coat polysaccharide biosynthesis predicted glycosyltransferase SpsG